MPTVDNVDKRGKKLKKSSSDDLRKYYELAGKWVCLEVWPTAKMIYNWAEKSANEAEATDQPGESRENLPFDLAETVDSPSSSEDGGSVKSDSSDSEDDEETDSTDIDADTLLGTQNQVH